MPLGRLGGFGTEILGEPGPELEARWRQELVGCELAPWEAVRHPELDPILIATAVRDYADRVAFMRDGRLGVREPVAPGIDVGQAVRGARALREAAAWLGIERLIVPTWRLVDGYGRRLARTPATKARSLITLLARRLAHPIPIPDRNQRHGIDR